MIQLKINLFNSQVNQSLMSQYVSFLGIKDCRKITESNKIFHRK